MRLRSALVALVLIGPAAVAAGAQEPVRDTSITAPAIGVKPTTAIEPVMFPTDPTLTPFGRLTPIRKPALTVAEEQAATMRRAMETRTQTVWGATLLSGFTVGPDTQRISPLAPLPVTPPPRELPAFPDDSARAASAARAPGDSVDIFGDYADLGLQLNSRLEAKGERNKNERCIGTMFLNPVANCAGAFQPTFDFQFNVRTGGVVADRVHVNVDYDSEREFEASNNISVYYEGRQDEMIERLEVGNVSFTPPASRFITSGIPSGNYGIQAIGQLGPVRFRGILAQQKGNLVKDQVYSVGERTLQAVENEIDDYKIEPRRFFFTVDPVRWFPEYPDIDILDRQQMTRLAAQLPDSVRPSKVFVYRYRFGSQPQNPNGPQFLINDRPDLQRGPIYELLREGVDYYLDPTQLWIALVGAASLNGERYVVTYTAGDGQTYRIAGDPVTSNDPARTLYANLLYDPSVGPDDPTFRREIRSVYRVGGDDIQRPSVTARIVTVNGQERPTAGTSQSYLQMFGIAQPTDPASFDVENRLWPRPTDPNYNPAAGPNAKTIRDYFLIFPSVEPFAARGLVEPGNLANDTIYRTPAEYLYSSQHPQPLYRIRLRYAAEGGGDAGTLVLGSVQVRPNSERLSIDNRPLVRGQDYTVDYELGRVTFSRPDTLFAVPRQVTVRYEENPLFTAAPTNIMGLAGEIPFDAGRVFITAISQSQKTTFNRPPLGFEPASSLVAGVSGAFSWDAPLLSRALERLPFAETSAPSRISISGELATSRPQPNAAGQAYVETFEGEGGVQISLGDPAWYLSSQPAAGDALPALFGSDALDLDRATAVAWQSLYSVRPPGVPFIPTIRDIDPLVQLQGQGITLPEQMLWLTLYPRALAGRYDVQNNSFDWTIPGLSGKRWRSIRTVLSPTGIDLTRVETLEFWALVDTSTARRPLNPVLVFDLGDISENTVAFQPETLVVSGTAAAPDSMFFGRKIVGLDTLDSERDPFSRTFNYTINDLGLPGDRVEDIVVIDETSGSGTPSTDTLDLCRARPAFNEILGDTRAMCTIGNSRLDEEDIDLDGQLNLPSAVRDNERVVRYVVNLGDPDSYSRIGKCYGSSVTNLPTQCFVYVRVPFRDATDTIGSPQMRRIKALRMTLLSGSTADDTTFQQVALARLKLVGSPWVKRQDRALRGIAGESGAGGYVIAGMIGTNDRDTLQNVFYEPPPGVRDEADNQTTGYEQGLVQINERSLRLLAGELDTLQRAEAYYRFPDTQKSFMGYRELRAWARGRGNGWGPSGEMQFFIKLGRDADNFYLYRSPANSGNTRAAWEPEIRVQFQRFFTLRARIQNAFLQGSSAPGYRRIDCTGTDSLLLAATPGALEDTLAFAACDGTGYMVFTKNPNVTPPNLAAVQELAVGMVRVARGGGTTPVQPGDTLELWVDDIRLTEVEDTPGYAGQVSLAITAGDLGDIRLNLSRRDPYFRQLGEQPSFITDDAFDIGTAIRVDKLLPARIGFALPVSMTHSSSGSDPLFVSSSDLEGAGIEGLRTPEQRTTSWSLGVRRSTPLRNKWVGPLVNNLSMNATRSTSRSRGEYSEATGAASTFTADYALVAPARTLGMPDWLGRFLQSLPGPMQRMTAVQSLRDAQFRWNPAQLRFTSGVARSSSTSLAFQKPAETLADQATTTRGLQHVWRTSSNLELRPFNALSAQWSFATLRDLRDYPDTSQAGVAAGAERNRVFGLDAGLERERQMGTNFSFSPQVSPWFRPRADVGFTYSYRRDANARELVLVQPGDTSSGFRLPKGYQNSQDVSVGANIEFGRLIGGYLGKYHVLLQRLALNIQPMDVTWRRTITSMFDQMAESPPVRYQVAFGGIGDFLSVDGRLPTSAGLTSTVGASGGVLLPLGMRITNRYSRTGGRQFRRRTETSLGTTDETSLNWPDASLQWNYSPTWARRVVTSVAGTVGYRGNVTTSFVPPENGAASQSGRRESSSIPLNGSIVWSVAGGISTNFSYSEGTAVDIRQDGSRTTSDSREYGADVGRAFKAPASWDLRDDIRTRIGYTRADQQSVVVSTGGNVEQRSQLANNGRHTINMNIDTDMNENLLFSLTGARTVTYDDQNNRRFSQLVVTAVLTLQFFAGELR